jgi:hypothetical protein
MPVDPMYFCVHGRRCIAPSVQHERVRAVYHIYKYTGQLCACIVTRTYFIVSCMCRLTLNRKLLGSFFLFFYTMTDE